MRRVLPICLPLVLLAACEASLLPPAGPDAAPGRVAASANLRAWFPPRAVVDTIEIDATDRLPLRAADLVAPDGTITHANDVNVAATPGSDNGQWQVGHLWDLPVASVSSLPGATPPPGLPDAAVSSQQRVLATVSTADVTLPDAVAYRRDWQHYRIRLTFGSSPGETETREIPAPELPASLVQ